MASTSPLALIIVFALVGALILPLLWWILAFWQRKYSLFGFYKVSLLLSLMPIVSVIGLRLGGEISAKYSVIFFTVSPFINLLAFITVLTITILKVRSQNAL
jgi:hypothetical protein